MVAIVLTVLAIVFPQQATYPEQLAAKEVRRYLYLRTEQLVPLANDDGKLAEKGDLIVIGRKDRDIVKKYLSDELKSTAAGLQPQQYLLRTIKYGERRVLLIVGGDDIGTLYGAYRFAEHLGVRFYMHGDTIPDEKIPLELPQLDEVGRPLFELRGIQPFHDFPEGPDWWNTENYQAIIGQLPKLRMNFFGLHTYPESHIGPEPTVWIGLAEDIEPNGKVKYSYPSNYYNTQRGNWGYAAKKTSDFSYGSAELFAGDDFGNDVQAGMIPWPKTPQENDEVFNRTAGMLKEAFELAHHLGIKTCVGTETPLVIPRLVKDRLISLGKDPNDPAVVRQLYEGMFQRITRAYPLDYYWLWTPERWNWQGASDEQVQITQDDILTAWQSLKKSGADFNLATCGWVLGPPKDRAQFDRVLPKEMPFSCINRRVGKEPVEPAFADISGREKWAIPWLEDDGAMISAQLWVGRMRKDAVDAHKYGCSGLMGIHWRTRIVGPNIAALAQAAWQQGPWKDQPVQQQEPPEEFTANGGLPRASYDHLISGAEDGVVYQSMRNNVKDYRIKLPNDKYRLTLKFCETIYNKPGQRVFSVKIQDRLLVDKLDMFGQFGKDRAIDYTFEGVEVNNGVLEIDFVPLTGLACISAIEIEGAGDTKKINCGGEAYRDYVADVKIDQPARYLSAEDFYQDWAWHEFGPEASNEIAAIFNRIDGILPETSRWIDGPGNIAADSRPWDSICQKYVFVDELGRLEPRIKGKGNRERYAYWLNIFRYMRQMAQVSCTLGELNRVMKNISEAPSAEQKKKMAVEEALPRRRELAARWADMMGYLLAATSTTGEVGNISNIEQHTLKNSKMLFPQDQELAELLGGTLPEETQPWPDYRGPVRIIVPAVRTSIDSGEDLTLKVIILGYRTVKSAQLYWRPMGRGKYESIALSRLGRGAHNVAIPARSINEADFEYYIKLVTRDGEEIYFPAAAPQINQTVVVTLEK